MNAPCNRRTFLQATGCATLAAGLGEPASAWADPKVKVPKVPDHTLTVIAGKPRERGRQYGLKFKDAIGAFLDKEIFQVCAKHASRRQLLGYAGQCTQAVRAYSPTIAAELEGMADGSGLKVEELVLITLHEEVAGHKGGKLPPVTHCTALAAGPPDTRDGNTYVGQNWDWMSSVYGLSSMLLWQRPEGPSLLAYSYPGLWAGAGLNDQGVALCWTWGEGMGILGPRVGIPAYVLIAQMLYQKTLEEAIAEARRAKHAGWFAFVLADARGNLATVEGTPKKLVVKRPRGHTARASYACREILGGSAEDPLKVHPQCQRMFDLLVGARGKLDQAALQSYFGDHKSTICKHPVWKGRAPQGGFTVDSMLFNCTTKEAFVSRGPGCADRWRKFTFPKG